MGARDGSVSRGEADAGRLGRARRADRAGTDRCSSRRGLAFRWPRCRRRRRPMPAPTWWAHLSGCAWVAAWLTARGREMLGPRELLVDDSWSGELSGLAGPRRTGAPTRSRRRGAGPAPGGDRGRADEEVQAEVAGDPRSARAMDRDRALRSLRLRVRRRRDARARGQPGRARRAAALEDGGLRVELLETIKQLALAASGRDGRSTRGSPEQRDDRGSRARRRRGGPRRGRSRRAVRVDDAPLLDAVGAQLYPPAAVERRRARRWRSALKRLGAGDASRLR